MTAQGDRHRLNLLRAVQPPALATSQPSAGGNVRARDLPDTAKKVREALDPKSRKQQRPERSDWKGIGAASGPRDGVADVATLKKICARSGCPSLKREEAWLVVMGMLPAEVAARPFARACIRGIHRDSELCAEALSAPGARSMSDLDDEPAVAVSETNGASVVVCRVCGGSGAAPSGAAVAAAVAVAVAAAPQTGSPRGSPTGSESCGLQTPLGFRTASYCWRCHGEGVLPLTPSNVLCGVPSTVWQLPGGTRVQVRGDYVLWPSGGVAILTRQDEKVSLSHSGDDPTAFAEVVFNDSAPCIRWVAAKRGEHKKDRQVWVEVPGGDATPAGTVLHEPRKDPAPRDGCATCGARPPPQQGAVCVHCQSPPSSGMPQRPNGDDDDAAAEDARQLARADDDEEGGAGQGAAQQPGEPSMDSIACPQCGERGHLLRMCPRFFEREKEPLASLVAASLTSQYCSMLLKPVADSLPAVWFNDPLLQPDRPLWDVRGDLMVWLRAIAFRLRDVLPSRPLRACFMTRLLDQCCRPPDELKPTGAATRASLRNRHSGAYPPRGQHPWEAIARDLAARVAAELEEEWGRSQEARLEVPADRFKTMASYPPARLFRDAAKQAAAGTQQDTSTTVSTVMFAQVGLLQGHQIVRVGTQSLDTWMDWPKVAEAELQKLTAGELPDVRITVHETASGKARLERLAALCKAQLGEDATVRGALSDAISQVIGSLFALGGRSVDGKARLLPNSHVLRFWDAALWQPSPFVTCRRLASSLLSLILKTPQLRERLDTAASWNAVGDVIVSALSCFGEWNDERQRQELHRACPSYEHW